MTNKNLLGLILGSSLMACSTQPEAIDSFYYKENNKLKVIITEKPNETPVNFDYLPVSSEAAVKYAQDLVEESKSWVNDLEWDDNRVGLKFYSSPLDNNSNSMMYEQEWGKEAMETFHQGRVYVRCLDPITMERNPKCVAAGIKYLPTLEVTKVKFREHPSGLGETPILFREKVEGIIYLGAISLALDLESKYDFLLE